MALSTSNHFLLIWDVTILLPLRAVICQNNSLFAISLLLICNLAVICGKFGVRIGPNESTKQCIGSDFCNSDICIISCY